MIITSLDNERIKNYIKLKDKKYRDLEGLFIVEGEHLVLEAYKSGILKEIILESDMDIDLDVPKTYVSNEIIKKISSVFTSQKIFGICKKMDKNDIGDKILILDGIQDPGNLGTIIRSATAFNIDTVIISLDTVDIYNPKVLRATQGTVFNINIFRKDLKEVINILKNRNISIYVTNVEYGEDIRNLKANDKDKFALVMGNEGNGVREEIKELADKYIYIQMNNKVESLNVSIATSILLYELGR